MRVGEQRVGCVYVYIYIYKIKEGVVVYKLRYNSLGQVHKVPS